MIAICYDILTSNARSQIKLPAIFRKSWHRFMKTFSWYQQKDEERNFNLYLLYKKKIMAQFFVNFVNFKVSKLISYLWILWLYFVYNKSKFGISLKLVILISWKTIASFTFAKKINRKLQNFKIMKHNHLLN